MRRIVLAAFAAAFVAGCAASREEVVARLGAEYIGQNVDVMVKKFGPPASTFKMNSGETSYQWQLGNQTNMSLYRGSGFGSTLFCKVSVITAPNGTIKDLTTEDANAGSGIDQALGTNGSICARTLGMAHSGA
jgi:hypothetical protein